MTLRDARICLLKNKKYFLIMIDLASSKRRISSLGTQPYYKNSTH